MESMLANSVERADGSRPVVMVVDDEQGLANNLAAILSRSFNVIAFYDGGSALRAARTTIPDLLLTDVVMPGMSGVELAIAMKDLVPQCKVLLFTGSTTTQHILSLAAETGYTFPVLKKPIHPTELLARIADVLRIGDDKVRPERPQAASVALAPRTLLYAG